MNCHVLQACAELLNGVVMSAEVRSWFGPAVANVATHPGVRALVAKWLQIRAEREPLLSDFWNTADQQMMDSSMLFMKLDDDYTYLHHGRYLCERIGFSMQGLSLRNLRTRVRSQLIELYDRATSQFDLIYFQSFADFAQDVVLWGRLCLPLRMKEGDDRVLLLVFCHMIEDKASLFRTLFTHSRYGIIVTWPIYNAKRQIDDAWIINQNAAAMPITGVQDHTADDLMLRAGPVFSDDALWRHFARGVPGGMVSAEISVSTSGSRYIASGELIDDYLVFHFAEQKPFDESFVIG